MYVYADSTNQKLEGYYQTMERTILDQALDQAGLSPESPEVRKMIANIRRDRPLVMVGPFAIFVANDNGEWSVRETPFLVPLIELKNNEQSKCLTVCSSLEKSWTVPRFVARFFYSEDGVYEWGFLSVWGKDGMHVRTYFDSTGSGIFDKMNVYENGVQVTYDLTDISWARVAEQPYTESLNTYESVLRVYGRYQIERNVSTENKDVEAKGKTNAEID